MRIAQVAPPFETVPPTKYGGTEFVVATTLEVLSGGMALRANRTR
jgi:hypothetical protein